MAEPVEVNSPPEPQGGAPVWYRGWECGWNDMAERYTKEGWEAYKGGCDLDARRVTAKTWAELLEAIDDEEDE